jgi:hypothetical protein
MGREKKKTNLSRRLVNYVDIQSAIRKLKIKAFKKSWRDRTSEYGLICKSTGRKNTKGNRLRIRAYIENRRRERKIIKKSKTEFSTAHISEESEQSDSDKHEHITEGNIQLCYHRCLFVRV